MASAPAGSSTATRRPWKVLRNPCLRALWRTSGSRAAPGGSSSATSLMPARLRISAARSSRASTRSRCRIPVRPIPTAKTRGMGSAPSVVTRSWSSEAPVKNALFNSRLRRPLIRQSRKPAAPTRGRSFSAMKTTRASRGGRSSRTSSRSGWWLHSTCAAMASLPPSKRGPKRSGLLQRHGHAVQQPVDERARGLAAKGLRELDHLVERHLPRDVVPVPELVDAQAQDVAVDAAHAVQAPVVAVLLDERVDLLHVVADALGQVLREAPCLGGRGALLRVRSPRGGQGLIEARGRGDFELVEGLEGPFTSGPPCAHAAQDSSPLPSRACRLTISRQARAASAPLLPAFTPARSMACSTVSQVRTPKPTGISPWKASWPRPLVHSDAPCSKWGVPPRITAPSATSPTY